MLADYKTAPISDSLRGLLAFLEKLTLSPETVTPADVEPLRALGLSDAAIEDAIHVTAMFNIFDRLADSMGWEVPAAAEFWPAQTKYLLKYGYEGGKKPRAS